MAVCQRRSSREADNVIHGRRREGDRNCLYAYHARQKVRAAEVLRELYESSWLAVASGHSSETFEVGVPLSVWKKQFRKLACAAGVVLLKLGKVPASVTPPT